MTVTCFSFYDNKPFGVPEGGGGKNLENLMSSWNHGEWEICCNHVCRKTCLVIACCLIDLALFLLIQSIWFHILWVPRSYPVKSFRTLLFCSDEGKVRKVLKMEPLPDGSGHLFNLSKHSLFLNFVAIFYDLCSSCLLLWCCELWYYEILGWFSMRHFMQIWTCLHTDINFWRWFVLM